MRQFKNILLVVDTKADNRTVLEHAIALAQKSQAQITVVSVADELPPPVSWLNVTPSEKSTQPSKFHVIEELTSTQTEQGPPESPLTIESHDTEALEGVATQEVLGRIREYIGSDAKQRLGMLVEHIEGTGIHASCALLFGTPFLEIIRKVVSDQHDLVMIVAEGKGGLTEKLFGNTTMRLMRKCPCPVWVVKPNQHRSHTRIMAAIDPDPGDKVRNALNAQILDIAISLAHQEQCELLIAHTWTVYGEAMLSGGFVHMSDLELHRYVQETRQKHLLWLSAQLENQPLDHLKYQIYMLKGNARELLPRLAQNQGVDLIVMGTVCRTGVAGFLMGNTAESILQQVDCSVLTLKPEGFETPVKLERL